MKTNSKQIFIGFLAFLLVFSGLNFASIPATAATIPAKAENPAATAFKPAISVVDALAQPVLAAGVRQDCFVAAVPDLLQGSSAAGLFSRPANCFSLNVAEPRVSQISLAVKALSANLPRIVVNDFSVQIQNELSFPGFPFRQEPGSLPLAAGIALLLFAFSDTRAFGRGNLLKDGKFLQYAAFGKLQILRC